MSTPAHPDAFTNAWLEQALGAPAQSLKGFSAKQIGTGQMSKSFRIALDWGGGEGPATIVAKCPSHDPSTKAIAAALGSYTLELGWYRELARMSDVACPRCIHLESANSDQDFVILLADLAPAQQGDQLAGASIKQIEAGLVQAARLHAPFWNNPRVSDFPWLAPNETSTGMVRTLLPVFYAQFRERYAQRLAPDILAMGDAFVSNLEAYLNPAPTALTIQHRDFRIDNLLFSPNHDQAFVVDWQTYGLGPGAHDVSYLIGTSIADLDLRAREEERLVRFYLAELGKLGVDAEFAPIWEGYRLYAFSGFLMAVFASMNVERTERGDEMFAVMAERPARQALHLGSLSLLGA
jgi:hypothetical protein